MGTQTKDLDNGPEDKFKLVYIIFYWLGIGTLLPWNMFITVRQKLGKCLLMKNNLSSGGSLLELQIPHCWWDRECSSRVWFRGRTSQWPAEGLGWLPGSGKVYIFPSHDWLKHLDWSLMASSSPAWFLMWPSLSWTGWLGTSSGRFPGALLKYVHTHWKKHNRGARFLIILACPGFSSASSLSSSVSPSPASWLRWDGTFQVH